MSDRGVLCSLSIEQLLVGGSCSWLEACFRCLESASQYGNTGRGSYGCRAPISVVSVALNTKSSSSSKVTVMKGWDSLNGAKMTSWALVVVDPRYFYFR